MPTEKSSSRSTQKLPRVRGDAELLETLPPPARTERLAADATTARPPSRAERRSTERATEPEMEAVTPEEERPSGRYSLVFPRKGKK